MPRTKLDAIAHPKPPKPPIDHLRALILERIQALSASPEDCAAAMGVSPGTYYRRRSQSTLEWPLGEIIALCRFLGVEVEELRAAIRYKGAKK